LVDAKENDQMSLEKGHPWGLILVKMVCFSILGIANRILIFRCFRGVRRKLKKALFYDRFAAFTRRNFYKGLIRGKAGRDVRTYRVGPTLICLSVDDGSPLITPLEWKIAHEYLDIVYPFENPKYLHFILAEGPYETGENVVIKNGDYVVDAGASLGAFSFLAAKRVGDTGHVFALEPVPLLRECLQESICANKSDNITILPMALGSNNGVTSFEIDYENLGGSKLGGKSAGISVTLRTLDTLVFEERLIPSVNFIKMHVEGNEREALLGAKETIFSYKPKLSIFANHRKDDFEVLSNIIRDIEPRYNLIYGKRKIYGYVD